MFGISPQPRQNRTTGMSAQQCDHHRRTRAPTPSSHPATLYFRPQVHGKKGGGDADELRLLSTKKKYINLRGHGGNLDFVHTKVTDLLLCTHCLPITHPITQASVENRGIIVL